ncbi:MAG: class II aldolase/adducin family protein [Luteibaculum sp.]
MIDEGYIKYHITWKETDVAPIASDDEIIAARNQMFDLNLIGYDSKNQVGYGNISKRLAANNFAISGTQTGHIPRIKPEHFTRVTDYNIAENRLSCEGPIKASSESLTHAAIYELDPAIKAVIHVHNKHIWENYNELLPTTKKDIPYGTPQMAREIFRLWRLADLPKQKILIMAGHVDGVISFDSNFEEAAERLEFYLGKL